MELTCKKCGAIQDIGDAISKKVPLPNGGYHHMIYCKECDAFVKNQKHSKEWKFYWGQYKGQAIKAIAKKDPAYLHWLLEQDNLKPSLRDAIEEALETVNAKEPELFPCA